MNRYILPALAMSVVVLASNILVQFPLAGHVGSLALGDLLTWGAFTYPFAFLVTDLTNRGLGPRIARRVVFVGFTVAVLTSITVPPILFDAGLLAFQAEGARLARIAMASGAAFLVAQLLDVTIFDRLRRLNWWKAPVVSSVASSVVDTFIFFTVAFAPLFVLFGPGDAFASESAPLFGVMGTQAPRWVSWALGDLAVKLVIAAVALIPYRIAIQSFFPYRERVRA